MPRKILVAVVKEEDLITVGSEIELELKCLSYYGKVWYEQGAYHIQGRDQINRFVSRMKKIINDCRTLFKDDESIEDFAKDEEFLNGLLKLKAT